MPDDAATWQIPWPIKPNPITPTLSNPDDDDADSSRRCEIFVDGRCCEIVRRSCRPNTVPIVLERAIVDEKRWLGRQNESFMKLGYGACLRVNSKAREGNCTATIDMGVDVWIS